MMLEAVWFKDGKEVYKVSPVMNVVCDDDMDGICEIEIKDWNKWHEYTDVGCEADDFVIRIKED